MNSLAEQIQRRCARKRAEWLIWTHERFDGRRAPEDPGFSLRLCAERP